MEANYTKITMSAVAAFTLGLRRRILVTTSTAKRQSPVNLRRTFVGTHIAFFQDGNRESYNLEFFTGYFSNCNYKV